MNVIGRLGRLGGIRLVLREAGDAIFFGDKLYIAKSFSGGVEGRIGFSGMKSELRAATPLGSAGCRFDWSLGGGQGAGRRQEFSSTKEDSAAREDGLKHGNA